MNFEYPLVRGDRFALTADFTATSGYKLTQRVAAG